MNTLKKNQIIITALAIMIAIAGYLNFTDKSDFRENKNVFSNEDINLINQEERDFLNVSVVEEPDYQEVAIVDEITLIEEGNIVEGNIVEGNIVEGTIETNESVIDGMVEEKKEKTIGEAVLVNSTLTNKSYFLESKIKREQTRAESKEILTDLINNSNIEEKMQTEAVYKMMQLQDIIEKEASAESLLEAKGYVDVFVRIAENNADVVVNVEKLSEIDLVKISDVVSRKTGFDPININITPIKIEE